MKIEEILVNVNSETGLEAVKSWLVFKYIELIVVVLCVIILLFGLYFIIKMASKEY